MSPALHQKRPKHEDMFYFEVRDGIEPVFTDILPVEEAYQVYRQLVKTYGRNKIGCYVVKSRPELIPSHELFDSNLKIRLQRLENTLL